MGLLDLQELAAPGYADLPSDHEQGRALLSAADTNLVTVYGD
jgi:hypothetical protein